MKGFILWTLFGVFAYLAATAIHMGEIRIGLVLAVIAVGCVWAAPSNSSKKRRKATAGSTRDH